MTKLKQLYSIPAMSNPRPACGLVEGFVRPSLGFLSSKSILDIDNLSFFDNLEFDIFDSCGTQCHFELLTLIFQTKFNFTWFTESDRILTAMVKGAIKSVRHYFVIQLAALVKIVTMCLAQ